MALAALLRNSFDHDSLTARILSDHGAFRFRRRRAQNLRKRDKSVAKPNENVSQRRSKPVEIITGVESPDFAELFIFNGLPAFSFRAISHKPFLDPRGPDQCPRVRPANASIQPFARPGFPPAREDKTPDMRFLVIALF
jgi:hypothetical protein